MLAKTRVLALGVAVAGMIGLAAPMASAAPMPGLPAGLGGLLGGPAAAAPAPAGSSSDSGGLLNLSHNQVPVNACGNDVPVNVLGVQVPMDNVPFVMGLLNGASVTSNHTTSDRGCSMINEQTGGGAGGHSSDGGLINLSHNQVPINLCGNDLPVNVLGVQVPADVLQVVLGLLGKGSVTSSTDTSHRGCAMINGQHG